MSLDYLIDSNIFISILNDELAEPLPEGSLGYSVLTEIELLSFQGLSLEDQELIRQAIALLERVGLSEEVVEKTIFLRRQYGLKTPDAIIAASAWAVGAVLLSNDKRLQKLREIQVRGLAMQE